MRYVGICKPSRDVLLDLDQVSIPCAVQPSPSENEPKGAEVGIGVRCLWKRFFTAVPVTLSAAVS
jgi:hypothetical protein